MKIVSKTTSIHIMVAFLLLFTIACGSSTPATPNEISESEKNTQGFGVTSSVDDDCSAITAVSFYDIDGDTLIGGYENIITQDSVIVDLAEMPDEFNIEVFSPNSVESVKGYLNDSPLIENNAAYRFPAGNTTAWDATVGEHTFSATAYPENRARGTAQCTVEFTFIVVDGTSEEEMPSEEAPSEEEAPAADGLVAPTEPTCGNGLSVLWQNSIDITQLNGSHGIPESAMRMKKGGTTQFEIPDLPADFDGEVMVTVAEAIAWDGYQNRVNVDDQPNERFKIVFLKNDEVVYETPWTGEGADDDGIATALYSDEWIGSLGEKVTLPDGADDVMIVHWADATYGEGDTSSYNSVVPSSLCIEYSLPQLMGD